MSTMHRRFGKMDWLIRNSNPGCLIIFHDEGTMKLAIERAKTINPDLTDKNFTFVPPYNEENEKFNGIEIKNVYADQFKNYKCGVDEGTIEKFPKDAKIKWR